MSIEINNILNKVLVKEFYRLNVGFFLLVLTIAFGFMSGREHKALAEFFIASPVILLIPISVWLIYLIKIVNFNHNQLYKKENRILFEISLLSRPKQCIQFFLALSGQYLPAILYGVFIIIIAIQYNATYAAIIIIITLLLFVSIASAIMVFRINCIHREIKITILKRYFDHTFTKPILQFYIEWQLRREPLLVISTKIFTGLLIFGVTQLYRNESYDWRLLSMGSALAFAGNFMIISQIHRFENYSFKLLRGLPINLANRLIIYVIVFFVFCLPECVVLLRNFPTNLALTHTLSIIFFGMSIGVFYYSLHYISNNDKKRPTELIFGSIFTWILLILFSTPLVAISVVNLVVGVILYRKYFSLYEYHATDPKEVDSLRD